MNDLFNESSDSTPLSEEEKEGLIPSYVTFRHELNALEQENILAAELWARRMKPKYILNEKFLRTLHQRMFGNVWKWAGKFRHTGKNIGVEAWQISSELKMLIDNVNFWIANKTFDPDEIATRFHHKLVWIHAFPNGNGRHSRLMTDLLLLKLQRQPFTWGSLISENADEIRREYITSLKEADQGNYKPLMAFVRR